MLIPIGATYLLDAGPFRSLWIECGVAAGFLAMAIFCAQFATTGRFQQLTDPIRQGEVMRLHRATGIVALGLVLLHPLLLFWDSVEYLEYLDPRVNLPRAAALITVTLAALGTGTAPRSASGWG